MILVLIFPSSFVKCVKRFLPGDARTAGKLAHEPSTGQNAGGSRMAGRPRPAPDVSGLLHAWRDGDLGARDEVMAVVYDELRRRAAAQLRRERAGITLQP